MKHIPIFIISSLLVASLTLTVVSLQTKEEPPKAAQVEPEPVESERQIQYIQLKPGLIVDVESLHSIVKDRDGKYRVLLVDTLCWEDAIVVDDITVKKVKYILVMRILNRMEKIIDEAIKKSKH